MNVPWEADWMFYCVAGPPLFRPLSQFHVSANQFVLNTAALYLLSVTVPSDDSVEGLKVDHLSMSPGAFQMTSARPHSPRAKLSGWT